MTEGLKNFTIVIGAFIAMECVAWLTHKYIMHGIGWFLHKDHHNKKVETFLERNDFFFLVFAIPGIIGLYSGMNHNFDYRFWAGLGITLYGAAYFLVHDIFIHQRFNLFRNTDSIYLRAIRKAHKVHHKHLEKEEGESFGMLWVSWKYFRQAFNSAKK